MKQEKFERQSPESLVIIRCDFPNHQIALALDTGASHTTIDLTALQIAGYDISGAIRMTEIETAGGVIQVYIFKVKKMMALGITKYNIEVCAYDFFAHHVLAEFDGVLGLDFLQDYKVCIDFNNKVITLHDF